MLTWNFKSKRRRRQINWDQKGKRRKEKPRRADSMGRTKGRTITKVSSLKKKEGCFRGTKRKQGGAKKGGKRGKNKKPARGKVVRGQENIYVRMF